MSNNLRNLLIGAGVAAVGGIGTKLAVDYFHNRGQEEPAPEGNEDVKPSSAQEVAYATVEPGSVQGFLDASFGKAGRYVPTRPAKVFEYQDQQYMVIWAYDNEKQKNQLLAFKYTDAGRKMVASVGYTANATDYNITLDGTNLAIKVNGKQITSGQGQTDGTDEVDLVPVG
ncbi:MAG: hypothetical protein WBV73_11765 [Phormidium sp.]